MNFKYKSNNNTLIVYVRSDLIRVRYKNSIKDYPSYSLANPELDHFEQSSEEIWETICNIIKVCTKDTYNGIHIKNLIN